MSRYPSAVVVTLVHNVFVTVVCAFVSLLAEKDNPKAWIIRFDITLISVVVTVIIKVCNNLWFCYLIRFFLS